jgi:hypothetical protein
VSVDSLVTIFKVRSELCQRRDLRGRHELASLLVSAAVMTVVGLIPQAASAESFDVAAPSAGSLGESRTYVVQGKQGLRGCQFTHPEPTPPNDEVVWEQRDIAMDMKTCRVLVEEGESAWPAETVALDGNAQHVDAIAAAFNGGSSTTEPLSAINPDEPTRRRQRIWYEDVLGLVVNSVDVKMTYYWDGSCSLGGSMNLYTTWLSGSGWYRVSSSASESETCARYQATGTAKFRNDTFCSQDGGYNPVTIWYRYNTVQGTNTGRISYTYSVDPFFTCAPLWFHRTTGSWSP